MTVPIDPVCVMHGIARSKHLCLYCCLCFEDLTENDCYVDYNGDKWDVCKPCAKKEAEAIAARNLDA